jgi:hypothetical protein
MKKLTLDQEIVLSCAFRYALGRMTYVVSSVTSELIKNEKVLNWNFKQRIAKEIQEYQDENGLAGMDFDNLEWNKVKWLFTKDRRVILEANKYKTDIWVEVEAVKGDNDIYWTLDCKADYHTVRNIRKK